MGSHREIAGITELIFLRVNYPGPCSLPGENAYPIMSIVERLCYVAEILGYPSMLLCPLYLLLLFS